ncbi:2,3-dihydroxybenzoate-AMP ligase [Streptomyces griseochromogenes]|uniref:2,3-dihydroxybenzoate-AMP ligase n=1 Tax=Streptomyces griseochromogenes TaxID=68214 RepID=A0A1B1B7W0_9ACTN|nr:AMP-binding protein [Streptomyces griseochromogenes]ANP54915.1 2,3-dihydroxybenzoyl adenylate synthase [Streptomyces griseochromogenes]MBP2050712.1 2,3-dihydroxybenzoate-AMP ligase [Streptomyces griseochromogenes]
MPLDGFTPWPEDTAAAYRRAGYWRGRTLPGLLHDWAAAHGPRTALVHGGTRLTYALLNRRVSRMAAGLRLRGVEPGRRVVVQLPNTPEFVIAVFALMRAGAIPVLSPTAHRDTEIAHLVAATESVGYIGPAVHRGFDHAAMAARIAAESTSLRRIFTLVAPGTQAGGFSVLPGGCLAFPLHTVDEAPVRDPHTDASDVAFFLLSGGTTALPELIGRTHDDYAYQLRATAEPLALGSEDVYLAALPAEFNLTLGCPGILGTLAVGGTVVLIDDPTPDTVLRTIEEEKVTVTSVVPAVAALWLDAFDGSEAGLGSLRVMQTGGARLDPGLAARVEPGFGCRLQQVFGTAEGLLTVTRLDDPDDVVLTTQGRPVSPADEIRIDAPAGQAGALLVRGPYTPRGYYRSPERNARAFTPDGFHRTGDLARLTPDGNLVVEGRIEDVVSAGGD